MDRVPTDSRIESSPRDGPAPPALEAAAGALEWRVHLACGQPGRAAAAAGAVTAATAWAFYLFQSPLPAVAAAGLLLAAVGEFLFPVRYRLTAEKAESRGLFCWRRIAWTEVKRVYVGNGEIKLSPLKYGGPREAFRGVVLRWEGDPGPVLAWVRRYAADAAPAGPAGSE